MSEEAITWALYSRVKPTHKLVLVGIAAHEYEPRRLARGEERKPPIAVAYVQDLALISGLTPRSTRDCIKVLEADGYLAVLPDARHEARENMTRLPDHRSVTVRLNHPGNVT